MAYSYSCSKGAFLGVSVESSVISVRSEVNHDFYGWPATPRELLLEGKVARPPAAALLYQGLQALTDQFENRGVHHAHAHARILRGASASQLPSSRAPPATATAATATATAATAAAAAARGLGSISMSALQGLSGLGASLGLAPAGADRGSSSGAGSSTARPA